MKVIQVCIGSACHLKGSYEVIQTLQKLIAENGLEKQVELKSAFCLGECSQAVSVQVHSGQILSILPEETEAFFKQWVLGEASV